MGYTTFEQISVRLGGQLSPTQQAFIEQKITEASSLIDHWCGQVFTPEVSATARTFRPSTTERCATDPFWTTTDLVVAVDNGDDGMFSTTLASSAYALDRFGGDMADVLGAPYDTIEGIGALFPVRSRRSRSVRVTAKWGWSAVPATVQGACEIVTVELWARKDAPFGITQSAAEFGGGLRIGRDVMAQVADMLRPFRRERTMGIA